MDYNRAVPAPAEVQDGGILARTPGQRSGQTSPRAVWSDRMSDMPGLIIDDFTRSTLATAAVRHHPFTALELLARP